MKAEPIAKARSMTIVIENTGAADMSFILPPTIISAAMNPVNTAMNNFPNWTEKCHQVNDSNLKQLTLRCEKIVFTSVHTCRKMDETMVRAPNRRKLRSKRLNAAAAEVQKFVPSIAV
jgi:hypothetical protein